MSKYLMVEVSPQVTVIFQGDKAVRAFIDINADEEQTNELLELAKELFKKAI